MKLHAKGFTRKGKIKNNILHYQYSNKDNNNRTLITGLSSCGKTFPMKYILFQEQGAVYVNTKSSSQNSVSKAHTSDETQPLEKCENITVVFDDMLQSKQASNIDLFFE